MGSKTLANRMNKDWIRFLQLVIKNISWKGVIFFLAGLFLLFFSAQQWQMGLASLNWKTIQGKIITSQAVVCYRRYLPSDYKARIVYQYSVNGILYSSQNIAFTTDSLTTYCGDAEKIMKEYPLGTSVLVYYDPENPKNSVLRPGGSSSASIAISLVMFGYGIKLFISESYFPKLKTKRYLKNRALMKR